MKVPKRFCYLEIWREGRIRRSAPDGTPSGNVDRGMASGFSFEVSKYLGALRNMFY